MIKHFLIPALVLAFFPSLGTAAIAQEDDNSAEHDATFEDSIVDFTVPDWLEANETYTFEFGVLNAAQESEEKAPWIYKVEMLLPEGGEYVLAPADEQPPMPNCLHPEECSHWEAMFDSTNNSITWQSFGMVTTVEYGDIRELDVQMFSFVATTDSEPGTVFAWALWGDEGAVVEGEFEFNTDDDENTDWPGDDDSGWVDDDDDDDGGCGC